jgi:hypothetical protein
LSISAISETITAIRKIPSPQQAEGDRLKIKSKFTEKHQVVGISTKIQKKSLIEIFICKVEIWKAFGLFCELEKNRV